MTSTFWRSLAKAATWKLIGITMLVIISYLAGATAAQIGAITVVYHLIMLFIYLLHERIWNKVLWGKISPTDVPTKDID